MWQETIDYSGRSQGYTLDLKELSLAVWRHVLKHQVVVRYEHPRKFYGKPSRGECPIMEINYNATAVRKTDGYWMQIKGSNATPRFEYSLCRANL